MPKMNFQSNPREEFERTMARERLLGFVRSKPTFDNDLDAFEAHVRSREFSGKQIVALAILGPFLLAVSLGVVFAYL